MITPIQIGEYENYNICDVLDVAEDYPGYVIIEVFAVQNIHSSGIASSTTLFKALVAKKKGSTPVTYGQIIEYDIAIAQLQKQVDELTKKVAA